LRLLEVLNLGSILKEELGRIFGNGQLICLWFPGVFPFFSGLKIHFLRFFIDRLIDKHVEKLNVIVGKVHNCGYEVLNFIKNK
jgi:hypothetical protein